MNDQAYTIFLLLITCLLALIAVGMSLRTWWILRKIKKLKEQGR